MSWNIVTTPAARLTMAVLVVLLARAVLRQPAPSIGPLVERHAPQRTAEARTATRTDNARVASNDVIDSAWREMYQVYGARIAQAARAGGGDDFNALWREIGIFLRARAVSAQMFRERMTDLGWPPEEQARHLLAAGYIGPPGRSFDGPEQFAKIEIPPPTDAPGPPGPR